MHEIQPGEDTFEIGDLDVIKAFHVARRVAPIQVAIGMSVAELVRSTQDVSDDMVGEKMMASGMEVVSKMSDEDVDYVIHTCLTVVKKKVGDRWAMMQVGGKLMFKDTSMQTMVRLVIETIRGNVQDFFVAPLDAPK
ncbi:MAG: phage tail assembly chaperone [Gaiellaceae bacterium]